MVHKKKNQDIIFSLYRDKRTVFRLVDVAMLVKETDMVSLSKKLHYHVSKGRLKNPRKGIYTKPGYHSEELACRLYAPSYISLDYVLQKEGVVFQYDTGITLVSYLTRTIELENRLHRFRKIKNPVLTNYMGVNRLSNHVNIASGERAFLDMLYLEPDSHFDNLNSLDKSLIAKLLPVYQSDALIKRTKTLLSNAGY